MQQAFIETLDRRLSEPNSKIQVILGPRQVGKTTGILQFLKKTRLPWVYFSGDDLLAPSREVILEQWQQAMQKGSPSLLVIDEIHKISNWSEVIKKLWDNPDHRHRVHLVVLGSSSLSIQQGLNESLTGRFETIHVHHWNYDESRHGFNMSLDDFLSFGGYPGAYAFITDYERWYQYVHASIVETVIGKDILFQQSVRNPALFRQAFDILCQYPAQELSYNKLLGQLQDKGNTDLVKHYLELYEGAFLIRTLQKYSGRAVVRKSSSPKILPGCPALFTAYGGALAKEDPEVRGRMLEVAVGMELARLPGELFYWREKQLEVDYVYTFSGKIWAVEVKSGRKQKRSGLEAFQAQFSKSKVLIITPENFPHFSGNAAAFLAEFAI